jgi:sulfur-oxidizing protein SoxY
MERRNFLGFGVAAVAASMVPASLMAENYRETKPKMWQAVTSADAIKEMYGTTDGIEGKIKLKAPKLAENGGSIPINIKTSVDLESVAIFQDANPRSAVAAFTIPEGAIINYDLRMKMRKTSDVTVIGKGRDGKMYKTVQKVEVSIGGCGG